MSAYLLLLLCMGLGIGMARWAPMPDNAPMVLNAWVVRVALPAMILLTVPTLHFHWDLLVLVLGAWWVMFGAMILMPIAARRFGFDRATVGCLILTTGLGNTSFVGLPLLQALRGPDARGPAIVADQLGTFFTLSITGIIVAAIYSGGKPSAAEIGRRIVRFPPFSALVAAFAIAPFFQWPPIARDLLQTLANSMTPLALFAVGLQFRFAVTRHDLKAMGVGLAWKLFVAPISFALCVGLWFHAGMETSVAILQTAMAPMITGGIVAQQHGLKPALANAVVSYGILASFLTVPLFSLVLP